MSKAINLPALMFKAPQTRRALFRGAALGAVTIPFAGSALASETLAELHPGHMEPDGHIRYRHMQFADKTEAMHTRLRMEFGLRDATYVWWYTFTLFAVMPQGSPVRLVRFEGMEMSEWRQDSPNEYIVHGHNVSFPQDYDTGEYLTSWENPLTGAIVTPQPTLLLGDPGRRKTADGDYELADPSMTLRPDETVFRIEGDLIHKDGIGCRPKAGRDNLWKRTASLAHWAICCIRTPPLSRRVDRACGFSPI